MAGGEAVSLLLGRQKDHRRGVPLHLADQLPDFLFPVALPQACVAEKQPVGVLFLQSPYVYLGKMGAEILPGGEDHLGPQLLQFLQSVVILNVKIVNDQKGIGVAELLEPLEPTLVILHPGCSLLRRQTGKRRVI